MLIRDRRRRSFRPRTTAIPAASALRPGVVAGTLEVDGDGLLVADDPGVVAGRDHAHVGVFRELLALWDASSKEPDERVFERATRVAQREFAKACKAAGVVYGSPHGITLHSLRHTAATRLVKGRMPLQMVGRILGHSQPQTTYRYLTADADATAQAAAIMEALQAKASEEQTAGESETVN